MAHSYAVVDLDFLVGCENQRVHAVKAHVVDHVAKDHGQMDRVRLQVHGLDLKDENLMVVHVSQEHVKLVDHESLVDVNPVDHDRPADEIQADHENHLVRAAAWDRVGHVVPEVVHVVLEVRVVLLVDHAGYVDANVAHHMVHRDEVPADHDAMVDHVVQVVEYVIHLVDHVEVVHVVRNLVDRVAEDHVVVVHEVGDRLGDIVVGPGDLADVDMDCGAMAKVLDFEMEVPWAMVPAEVALGYLPARAKPFLVEGAAQSIDFFFFT